MLKKLFSLLVGVVFVALILSGMETIKMLDDDTIVFVDSEKNLYFTMACAEQGRTERNVFLIDQSSLIEMKIGDVRNTKSSLPAVRPDRECSGADGFVAEKSNLLMDILGSVF